QQLILDHEIGHFHDFVHGRDAMLNGTYEKQTVQAQKAFYSNLPRALKSGDYKADAQEAVNRVYQEYLSHINETREDMYSLACLAYNDLEEGRGMERFRTVANFLGAHRIRST